MTQAHPVFTRGALCRPTASTKLPARSLWALVLALLGLISAVVPAKGQQYALDNRLKQLNHALQNRLERTYKYQQALDADSSALVRRYLIANHKRYLVEYRVRDLSTLTQTRENYALRFINHDTLCISQARYVATKKREAKASQLSVALASEYTGELTFEAHSLLVNQTFDPVAVLALRPGPARSGQWLHAVERGDTLASYYLWRSRTGDTCRVQLYERRPGRPARQPTWVWVADVAHRRLTAALDTAASGGQYWDRTYHSATAFSEVATTIYRNPAHPGRQETSVVYRREFRRLSPHQALETYTVPDEAVAATTPLLFTILSTYD